MSLQTLGIMVSRGSLPQCTNDYVDLFAGCVVYYGRLWICCDVQINGYDCDSCRTVPNGPQFIILQGKIIE